MQPMGRTRDWGIAENTSLTIFLSFVFGCFLLFVGFLKMSLFGKAFPLETIVSAFFPAALHQKS